MRIHPQDIYQLSGAKCTVPFENYINEYYLKIVFCKL